MKTYKIVFEISTESSTEIKELHIFADLKLAEKEFKKEVKNIYRGKNSDYENVTESIVLELWESGCYETELNRQEIYAEGVIDRMNWKGDYAINYYYHAIFNGKELMHEMFFQGKKENWGKKRKVPNSQLSNWYFR